MRIRSARCKIQIPYLMLHLRCKKRQQNSNERHKKLLFDFFILSSLVKHQSWLNHSMTISHFHFQDLAKSRETSTLERFMSDRKKTYLRQELKSLGPTIGDQLITLVETVTVSQAGKACICFGRNRQQQDQQENVKLVTPTPPVVSPCNLAWHLTPTMRQKEDPCLVGNMSYQTLTEWDREQENSSQGDIRTLRNQRTFSTKKTTSMVTPKRTRTRRASKWRHAVISLKTHFMLKNRSRKTVKNTVSEVKRLSFVSLRQSSSHARRVSQCFLFDRWTRVKSLTIDYGSL